MNKGLRQQAKSGTMIAMVIMSGLSGVTLALEEMSGVLSAEAISSIKSVLLIVTPMVAMYFRQTVTKSIDDL